MCGRLPPRPAGPTSAVPGMCAFTSVTNALFLCYRLSTICVAVTVFVNGEPAPGARREPARGQTCRMPPAAPAAATHGCPSPSPGACRHEWLLRQASGCVKDRGAHQCQHVCVCRYVHCRPHRSAKGAGETRGQLAAGRRRRGAGNGACPGLWGTQAATPAVGKGKRGAMPAPAAVRLHPPWPRSLSGLRSAPCFYLLIKRSSTCPATLKSWPRAQTTPPAWHTRQAGAGAVC